MGKYFGTDGIRGKANEVLTPELVLCLGKAVAQTLVDDGLGSTVIIGRDTRLSGDMLEAALAAGIAAGGMDVLLLGVIPTPGVAMLCRLYEGPGVVISASHNPFYDNGIKFFSSQGLKLTDAQEAQIEDLLDHPEKLICTNEKVGRVRALPNAADDYRALLLQAQAPDLSGLKIGVDCANGAASPIAKDLFRTLGAEVTALAEEPDGLNINLGCGSTHPENLQELVKTKKLDLGLAFDGDADRLIAVDETGALVDGDLLLAVMAQHMQKQNRLAGNQLVMTILSNMALRLKLQEQGIIITECPVGDRHVLAKMQENGANLGGEQSGHLILADYNSTGDALAAALYLLTVLRQSKQSLHQLVAGFELFPQVHINVPVKTKEGWQENPMIAAAIEAAKQELAGQGRVLVRPSGTEQLLRVMTEGRNRDTLQRLAKQIVQAITQELN